MRANTPSSMLIVLQFSLLVSSLSIAKPVTLTTPKNSTILTSEFECKSGRPRGYTSPHQQNCALALRQFPSEPDIHNFHNDGDGDVYMLPWFERHKDCEILVNLRDGNQERSSWIEVGLAAMEIITGCTDVAGLSEGGRTLAGWDDKLLITIRGYDRAVGDVAGDAAPRGVAATA